ncbi:hypothetical protein [Umezawaea sp. NPDC059074]|uniref:hypothetical protein n=1 Tax=Umezawaea sp. NPDC059074 TaxID=3346716 RepID=UPI003676DE46
MKVQRKSAVIVSGVALVLAAAIGGGIAIGGGSVVAATSTPGSTTSTTSAGTPSASAATPSVPAATPAPVAAVAAPVEQIAKSDPPPPVVKTDEGPGLRLGMSEEEALATGLLVNRGVDDAWGCHTYSTTTFPDTPKAVVISPTTGVARLTQASAFRTTEGIGVGSTAADVRNTYPQARESRLGFSVFPYEEWNGYHVFLMSGEMPFLDTDKVQRVRTQWSGAECFLD